MKREKLISFRGNRTQTEMGGENTPSLPIMKKLEDDIGIPMEEIFLTFFTI